MKGRKFIAVLSALTLLTGSLGGMAVSAAAKGNGDADENGKVEIADAILLARWLAEDSEITVTAQGLVNADMTGDGQVTTDDAAKLLCWLAGLTDEDPHPSEGRSVDLLAGVVPGDAEKGDPADAAFRAAQAKFSVDLLKQVLADEEDKSANLMISPVSVSLALGMTMNGAKGDTRTEMEKVLGDTLTAEQLNAYYAGWSEKLLSPAFYEEISLTADGRKDYITEEYFPITLANAIWIKDNEAQIRVPQSFLQTTADYYRAGFFRAPFDRTTVDDINGWCDEHTNHMIPAVIDGLEERSVMVLVNALTFEDDWQTPYQKFAVEPGYFNPAEGEAHEVLMMHGNEKCYLQSDQATGFIKPYWDQRYSFAAVLPNEDITLDEYIAGLDGEALSALLSGREKTDVITMMPRFSFDYESELAKTLQTLGMETAFRAGTADFTGLNEAEGIYTWIDEVIHKTHIEVNEVGTKAAAVTAVVMRGGGMYDPEVKQVLLNRPFLFMIIDNETNLPLFIGAVKDVPAEM